MGCRDERPMARTGPSKGQLTCFSPIWPVKNSGTDSSKGARATTLALGARGRQALLASKAVMDHAKFTTIAHRHHRTCNPVDPAALERVIGLADLRAGQKVLDLGCGKAALLIHLAGR